MTNGIVGPQAGGIFMNQLPLVDCKEYWQSFGFGSPVPSIAQTDKDAAITLHQSTIFFFKMMHHSTTGQCLVILFGLPFYKPSLLS